MLLTKTDHSITVTEAQNGKIISIVALALAAIFGALAVANKSYLVNSWYFTILFLVVGIMALVIEKQTVITIDKVAKNIVFSSKFFAFSQARKQQLSLLDVSEIIFDYGFSKAGSYCSLTVNGNNNTSFKFNNLRLHRTAKFTEVNNMDSQELEIAQQVAEYIGKPLQITFMGRPETNAEIQKRESYKS